MTKTHIRLFRANAEGDTGLMLVPIDGTLFKLSLRYGTLVVLPDKTEFHVRESISEISAMLETIHVHHDPAA